MEQRSDSDKSGYEDIVRTTHALMGSTGDYNRFKELLRRRLTECGWSDQIRIMCRDTIKEKGTNLTADQLLEEVSPKARATIPTTVKRELLQKVKEHLLNEADYYNKENDRLVNN